MAFFWPPFSRKNFLKGFSILEALVASAVASVALVGFSGVMTSLVQQSKTSNQWLSTDRFLIDTTNDLLFFPEQYRSIGNNWTSCSGFGNNPSFDRLRSRCILSSNQDEGINLEFRSANVDQASNFVPARGLELRVNGSPTPLTILLPPEHVEFPSLKGESYPDRSYRIKSWRSSTAERFKGRYFGVPSLPQYTIYRTRDWREMVAEMAKVQPKYVDGTPMSVVCSPGTTRCTRGDAFTIICDPRIGPCARYESSPALIEYISKGDCGPPCM